MRTIMIESSWCKPAFVISRCTSHSLRLIAPVQNDQSGVGWGTATPATPALTRRVNAITESRGFRVSIASAKLMGFTVTYNIVRQKEAIHQPSTAFPLNMGSRSWYTRPQPSAMRLQLSDEERQTGRANSPTKAKIAIEGAIHTQTFLL